MWEQYYQVVAGSGFYLSSNFGTPFPAYNERATTIHDLILQLSSFSYEGFISFSTTLVSIRGMANLICRVNHLDQVVFFTTFIPGIILLHAHTQKKVKKDLYLGVRKNFLFSFHTGVFCVIGFQHYSLIICTHPSISTSITIFYYVTVHVCHSDWAFSYEWRFPFLFFFSFFFTIDIGKVEIYCVLWAKWQQIGVRTLGLTLFLFLFFLIQICTFSSLSSQGSWFSCFHGRLCLVLFLFFLFFFLLPGSFVGCWLLGREYIIK